MSERAPTAAAEFSATQELSVKDANKVAIGALIGTALEWYDFFLFSAAAALIFNVQYFTNENATAAALASFATFGVGLAARPVGDRKSTRLNSSHVAISYAVFCLK